LTRVEPIPKPCHPPCMTGQAKKPTRKALQRWETEGGATEDGPQTPKGRRPHDANQLSKSIADIASGETNDRESAPEEQAKDPSAISLGRCGLNGGKARGGEHDTNAARADREGSSQGTLEQALEPKRDVATLQQLDPECGAFQPRWVRTAPRPAASAHPCHRLPVPMRHWPAVA
jgi:hypothetical protein